MDKKMIGKMIAYERSKQGISAQRLSEGVCSVSALQRLESGVRLPDFFVLERLIERLGKSVNKMEFLYDEGAYDIYYLREIIEKSVEQREYEEAEGALAYYESRPEAGEPLHRQYICKMRAVMAAEREENHTDAIRLLKEALEQTVPGFSWSCLEDYCMGEGEILLLLLWLQENQESGEEPIPVEPDRILQYIDKTCQDEEAKANIYSKAAWVLGTMAMGRQQWREALRLTLRGEEILADNALLIHLPQFLDRIVELEIKCDAKESEAWKRQRDALRKLYDEYGEQWDTGRITLWKNYRQTEVYLVSELFGQERRLIKQSQEKLADVLDMDQKTISRIEGGKYKPKAGTFRKMKEYLQIDRDICTTRIVVEDFSLLELERKIAKLNTHRHEAEAEALFKQLKSRLSLKWKENEQYIKYLETLFDKELGRISQEEAIRRCEEALKVTRKKGMEQLDGIVFSRMEMFIINYIAMCYVNINEIEKASRLLEQVIHGYENSKVDLKYHYVSLAILYQNLAFNYEESNHLMDAIHMCDKTIMLDLKCKRALNIGFILVERQYSENRMNDDRKSGKDRYQQAYQILKLLKKDRQMRNLQRQYERWYEEKFCENP